MTFGEDKWDKAYERVVLTEDKTGFKNTQNLSFKYARESKKLGQEVPDIIKKSAAKY